MFMRNAHRGSRLHGLAIQVLRFVAASAPAHAQVDRGLVEWLDGMLACLDHGL